MNTTFSTIDTTFLSTEAEFDYAIKVMRNELRNYIHQYGLKALVLGISGGVDSAFAAALVRPVCDELQIPLIGRSITIETNKPEEIERANAVGENFCHDYKYLDYTDIYLKFKPLLPDIVDNKLSKLRMGNAKARFRMMALYDLAQEHRGIVISTDNFTEYLTGFWTLHGDVGDYAPFIKLWKTEVYGCSKFLCKSLPKSMSDALMACVEAVPTDGLGITNSDLDQLGTDTYAEVDRLLAEYLSGNKQNEKHPVVQRYLSTQYKRENPVSIERIALVQNHD
ncbi:MAG: NAD(+) synthase [Bacteroidales bacterium]|nr:NAD(+) synthase [Bacteroidales bacterium]